MLRLVFDGTVKVADEILTEGSSDWSSSSVEDDQSEDDDQHHLSQLPVTAWLIDHTVTKPYQQSKHWPMFIMQSLVVMPGCKLEVWDKGDGQEQVDPNFFYPTLFSSSRLQRRRKSLQMLEISGTTKTGDKTLKKKTHGKKCWVCGRCGPVIRCV